MFLAPALTGILLGLSNTAVGGGFRRADVIIPVTGGIALGTAFVVRSLRRGARSLVDVTLLPVRQRVTPAPGGRSESGAYHGTDPGNRKAR